MDVVEEVLAAVAAGDASQARLALHPYLRWTDPTGRTIRGRTNVLAALDGLERPLARPADVELRDGQVHRWREPVP